MHMENGIGIIAHHIAHQFGLGLTEAVNRLFDIAHPEDGHAALCFCDGCENRILQKAGVLELIDHDFIKGVIQPSCDTSVLGSENLKRIAFHVGKVHADELLFHLSEHHCGVFTKRHKRADDLCLVFRIGRKGGLFKTDLKKL